MLSQQTLQILRREPMYHKLQYSKSPKFDSAAATLGVGLGAFVVYLALNGFGSMGTDLTDLTSLVWYTFLWLGIARLWRDESRENPEGIYRIFLSPWAFVIEWVSTVGV